MTAASNRDHRLSPIQELEAYRIALWDLFLARGNERVKDDFLVTEISGNPSWVADEIFSAAKPFCKNEFAATELRLALHEFFRAHSWGTALINEPMLQVTRITGDRKRIVKFIFNLSYTFMFTTT
jgi:hypothetical protein